MNKDKKRKTMVRITSGFLKLIFMVVWFFKFKGMFRGRSC